jgi:exopolyphosphatase/guanosine-5'-triphosphate,3'-diphosphate pyrophosphatase
MAENLPRWEWRTWGRNIKLNVDVKEYEHTRRAETKEVYVLSILCDENVKIRENRLDVKSLQCVDGDLLEQWKPIKKAAFPLKTETFLEIYKLFHLPPPSFRNDTCTMEDFLMMVKKEPRLLIFNVGKKRNLFNVDGCKVECSEVTADGREYTTVAAELEDPEKVKRTVRLLGLWDRENLNYVKALKKIRSGQL